MPQTNRVVAMTAAASGAAMLCCTGVPSFVAPGTRAPADLSPAADVEAPRERAGAASAALGLGALAAAASLTAATAARLTAKAGTSARGRNTAAPMLRAAAAPKSRNPPAPYSDYAEFKGNIFDARGAVKGPPVDFSKELGVCPPLGFWDPLGLSKFDDPEFAIQQFKRRRSLEIQHGRVAMAACIGYIVPEYYRFPGVISKSLDLKFEDIPNGLKAIGAVPGLGIYQIIGFAAIIEISQLGTVSTDKKNAGDFDGYGAFGLPFGPSIKDPEKQQKSLLAEINNGRLAMVAIIGMFFQDGLTGSAWGDWSLYTMSPLRAQEPRKAAGKVPAPYSDYAEFKGNIFDPRGAVKGPPVDFSKELGASDPLGFWDPLGLSKFDDPEYAIQQFKRRRSLEIQHGRVAMAACIGYIVPEYYRFPGFISKSLNLKFEDIPNGLKAIGAVPGLGIYQIVGFAAIIEISQLGTVVSDKKNAGDFDGFGAFGLPFGPSIKDPVRQQKSLLAEINNGRLAMVSIIGMFFQDGLTGSAWGDWSLYTMSPLRAQKRGAGNKVPAPYSDYAEFKGNIFDPRGAVKGPPVDFSKELGAGAPLGFWDPLGLSKFDDPEFAVQQFKRRRSLEIQHGRVAMAACIGYIVPEYYRFPGFISKSLNLKFEDIPNGLKAIGAVPGLGIYQIIGFAAVIEISQLGTVTGDKKYQGDFDGYGAFGLPFGPSITDPVRKEKSLAAEINNGRLAMVSIIGMFFQDGLTGSAWGDWSLYTMSPLRSRGA